VCAVGVCHRWGQQSAQHDFLLFVKLVGDEQAQLGQQSLAGLGGHDSKDARAVRRLRPTDR